MEKAQELSDWFEKAQELSDWFEKEFPIAVPDSPKVRYKAYYGLIGELYRLYFNDEEDLAQGNYEAVAKLGTADMDLAGWITDKFQDAVRNSEAICTPAYLSGYFIDLV